jgi:hypothetical protein
MEEVSASETLENFYQTTRLYSAITQHAACSVVFLLDPRAKKPLLAIFFKTNS